MLTCEKINSIFEQRQGTLATGPNQSVKEFLEYWLENIKGPGIRLGTRLTYGYMINKHLIPGVGHVRIQNLTTHQLQLFYARKMKAGVSVVYLHRINGVLSQALSQAKRIRLVGRNVAEDVELPHSDDYEGPVLNEKEARLLLEKARERGQEALIAMAVITAMRKGEILSLRWSDIDEKGVLHISRTLHYYAKYGFVEGDPKSRSSGRDIVLPQVIIGLLQRHRVAQLELRLKAGSSWIERDLIFCRDNGDFIISTSFWYQFCKLLRDAGLPHMRFHDLRHSAATILLSMGVPPHVVQELLGHADIRTTLGIYGHVIPKMRQDAADKMGDLFGG
jgi:integrase